MNTINGKGLPTIATKNRIGIETLYRKYPRLGISGDTRNFINCAKEMNELIRGIISFEKYLQGIIPDFKKHIKFPMIAFCFPGDPDLEKFPEMELRVDSARNLYIRGEATTKIVQYADYLIGHEYGHLLLMGHFLKESLPQELVGDLERFRGSINLESCVLFKALAYFSGINHLLLGKVTLKMKEEDLDALETVSISLGEDPPFHVFLVTELLADEISYLLSRNKTTWISSFKKREGKHLDDFVRKSGPEAKSESYRFLQYAIVAEKCGLSGLAADFYNRFDFKFYEGTREGAGKAYQALYQALSKLWDDILANQKMKGLLNK